MAKWRAWQRSPSGCSILVINIYIPEWRNIKEETEWPEWWGSSEDLFARSRQSRVVQLVLRVLRGLHLRAAARQAVRVTELALWLADLDE